MVRVDDGRYGVGEKMTLAIDINSNMVHAINGRLSDMDVSAVRGTTAQTDRRRNERQR